MAIAVNQRYSLQFNVSHSQDVALYGITKHNLIGVDIEYIRDDVDCIKIAERFFNPQEYQSISNLNSSEQAPAFYYLWTIKEAYLKATGLGLIGGLDTVEVAVNSANDIKVKAISALNTAVNDWFFCSFQPYNNFIATVAVNDQQQDLTIKQFSLN